MRLICCGVSQRAITHRVVPFKNDTEREFLTILGECQNCNGKQVLITRLKKDGSVERILAKEDVKRKLLEVYPQILIERNITGCRLNNIVALKYIPLKYANRGKKYKLMSCYTSALYKSSQWDTDYKCVEKILARN